MESSAYYSEVSGILGIFSVKAEWPNSANAFLVPDDQGFTLIDIGCGGDGGIRQFATGLSHYEIEPAQIHTVICSHAHPDHMGALKWLLRRCHPRLLIHHKDMAAAENPEKLRDNFDIPLAKKRWRSEQGNNQYEDFELLDFFRDFGCLMNPAADWESIDEGDELQLGSRRFRIIHTPGHAPGHVSFFEEKTNTLLAGDIVGKSPAWYTPTSGGVIGYLESLDKIERLDAAVLLPSHGPVIENPATAIENIRRKLQRREEILLMSLQEKPKRYRELLKCLFPSSFLHFFPGIGILESHLRKLLRDEKIKSTDGEYRLLAG